MKLLVADGDQNICRIIKKALEKSNYTVDTARDLSELISLIEQVPYDAVVMDNNMEGIIKMKGIESVRKITDSPLLIMSTSSETDDKVSALDAGADDYLAKPFVLSELMARIRAMLRRRGSYTGLTISFANLHLDCAGYVLYTDAGSFN